MNQIGSELKIIDVSKRVKIQKKQETILSNISFEVNQGEFIAIVGCSGAGKTTLMNILSGYNYPSTGQIYIDGVNFLENEEYFKGKIAYVPQRQILDQSLSLAKSLEYSLKLRVKGISKKEIKKTLKNVLNILELTHVKNTIIKNLSGGEMKRAAIATEMLSNPDIFLLDEPTSGLDANIAKKIMIKLRQISNSGKTIIMTSHTTSDLDLCDKVLFMGPKGRICYYGPYKDIFNYFNVKEFAQIYDILKEDSEVWYKKFCCHQDKIKVIEREKDKPKKPVGFFKQTITLIKRYVSSLINNKMMLILFLGQAILMAVLMCLATEKNSFLNPLTASMMCAALTMASIWLGLFNTIQEIVKEREILKKEYMSGLNFSSYIFSKIIVISLLCLYQSITCVSILYFHLDPHPKDNLIFTTLIDLIINFFIIDFSTSIMGLFISAVVKDAKTTLIISPLYMMVQMIFSGMFIPFVKLTKNISYFTSGRWSFETFGSISNLTKYGVLEPSTDFFKFTSAHVLSIWNLLIVVSLFFLSLSILAIRINILNKDKNYKVLNEYKSKIEISKSRIKF